MLTGREKDLIVRSGHNIDPAAIEDVANAFPGVQMSSAVGMPDAYAGEVPILFVVPSPDHAIDLQQLQEHVERNINEPPAKPKRVVVLESLPVTAVGKIFKPALRDLAVKEKVRSEIDRIFGAANKAEIHVDKDDKLNTVVRISVDTDDAGRIRALAESLSSLPQTYLIEQSSSGPAERGNWRRPNGWRGMTRLSVQSARDHVRRRRDRAVAHLGSRRGPRRNPRLANLRVSLRGIFARPARALIENATSRQTTCDRLHWFPKRANICGKRTKKRSRDGNQEPRAAGNRICGFRGAVRRLRGYPARLFDHREHADAAAERGGARHPRPRDGDRGDRARHRHFADRGAGGAAGAGAADGAGRPFAADLAGRGLCADDRCSASSTAG